MCCGNVLARIGPLVFNFFFFNDTATTEIYTLSLHDALPISNGEERVGTSPDVRRIPRRCGSSPAGAGWEGSDLEAELLDRKSTRLNSSHANISYAVFCLKNKTNRMYTYPARQQFILPCPI